MSFVSPPFSPWAERSMRALVALQRRSVNRRLRHRNPTR
jgi:hypothetical protein